MPPKKILFDRKLLSELYIKRELSTIKIGNILNCSWATVRNRLLELKIPLKNSSLARMKYKKYDFNFDDSTKAYMIGFRIGDLNVYKTALANETVIARCHTTQKEQVKIIKLLFSKFGKVTISARHGHFHVNCFLNSSFNFLLSKEKNSWNWLKSNPKFYFPFIAGYTDAEGNFILNQKKARFKIDSYDIEVLKQISFWLYRNKIHCKFRRIYEKGELRYEGGTWNKDLWRLNVNDAESLYKFINKILPFLHHPKRIKDAKICLANIKSRKVYDRIVIQN
ncbi:MAG TPA: LAGLIDADG family homing endonuclease [Candidatus Paceibacterota bacterium]|nr:LAGLIDADG family homing endonuclease [Candidatus Paceibacterota bacterium]